MCKIFIRNTDLNLNSNKECVHWMYFHKKIVCSVSDPCLQNFFDFESANWLSEKPLALQEMKGPLGLFHTLRKWMTNPSVVASMLERTWWSSLVYLTKMKMVTSIFWNCFVILRHTTCSRLLKIIRFVSSINIYVPCYRLPDGRHIVSNYLYRK